MTESTNQQFGKYRIEFELGRGGFGAVFQAVDTTLERTIALKILDPLLMRDGNWVMNFRKEARVMAKLEHPHIVPIYETGEEDGRLYIAMKLIEGGNLAAYIRQHGRLSWNESLRIVQEIASALEFAHEQRITHRDLKPDNILLGADGTAVLTDFGFTRLVSDNSMSVSMSGGIVGTPAYIAPEVWEGKNADQRADIYALGCILYEMLTGQVLFQGDSAPAIMLAHFQSPPLPEEWPSDIPDRVQTVLRTALSRDPAGRYVSAGEMVRDLRQKAVDKLARPYRAVELALAAQEWDKALALATSIANRNPNYRDIQALQKRAAAERERAQQVVQAPLTPASQPTAPDVIKTARESEKTAPQTAGPVAKEAVLGPQTVWSQKKIALGVVALVSIILIAGFALLMANQNGDGAAAIPPGVAEGIESLTAVTDVITATLTSTTTLTDEATPVPLEDTTTNTPTATITPMPTAADTPIPTATMTPMPTATDTPFFPLVNSVPSGLLAFVSNHESRQDAIYYVDLDLVNAANLNPDAAQRLTHPATGERDWWPTWCDQNNLYFERSDERTFEEIYYIALVGPSPNLVEQRVTSNRLPAGSDRNGSPSCSPDGRYLAFSSRVPPSDRYSVGYLNIQQMSQQNEFFDLGYAHAGAVTWSPDSQTISFMRHNANLGRFEIYRLGLDDPQTPLILTANYGRSSKYPAWSPDGSQIAFACLHEASPPSWRLCVTPSDHAGVRPLLDTNLHIGGEFNRTLNSQTLTSFAITPSWSPDGRWLAFTYTPGANSKSSIYLYNLAENAVIPLTENWPGRQMQPQWAP
jgi:Tol biopolymer transport system component